MDRHASAVSMSQAPAAEDETSRRRLIGSAAAEPAEAGAGGLCGDQSWPSATCTASTEPVVASGSSKSTGGVGMGPAAVGDTAGSGRATEGAVVSPFTPVAASLKDNLPPLPPALLPSGLRDTPLPAQPTAGSGGGSAGGSCDGVDSTAAPWSSLPPSSALAPPTDAGGQQDAYGGAGGVASWEGFGSIVGLTQSRVSHHPSEEGNRRRASLWCTSEGSPLCSSPPRRASGSEVRRCMVCARRVRKKTCF